MHGACAYSRVWLAVFLPTRYPFEEVKMKRKAHIILLVLLLLCVLSTTAFAIDESEVESAIAASSKEEVAGNVFIWFLCAIGFLKVSQKIDSFMASLGINVGRTGGSMLTELMVAGRGIAAVAGAVGGTVFNHHSSSNSTHTNAQAAGAAFTGGGNGLVGVTRRAAGNAAAASATGNAKGLSNLVGGAMFESSLQNGGKFAMSVVGAVAKGSISSVGSITGDQAAEALTSYLGYSPVDSGSALADDGGLIPPSPINYLLYAEIRDYLVPLRITDFYLIDHAGYPAAVAELYGNKDARNDYFDNLRKSGDDAVLEAVRRERERIMLLGSDPACQASYIKKLFDNNVACLGHPKKTEAKVSQIMSVP